MTDTMTSQNIDLPSWDTLYTQQLANLNSSTLIMEAEIPPKNPQHRQQLHVVKTQGRN
jgi:hypothetical protein